MNATSCKVTVLRQSTVAADIRCLTVQWPDASRPAKAGQFFMLRAWAANETPILSRPISVHDFDAATGALTFLYQVKGEGTQKLAALKEGDTLTVTGPCGNGFDVAAIARAAGGKNGKIAVVGGGIGTAPLLQLCKELAAAGCKPELYCGFRDEPYGLEAFLPYCAAISIATDSGAVGYHGLVTGILHPEQFAMVLTCGPMVMMRGVYQLCAQSGTPCLFRAKAVILAAHNGGWKGSYLLNTCAGEGAALAYGAVCRPLCQELGLAQTAFDILLFLANNPTYKTARDIVEVRHIKANLVSIHVDRLVREGYLTRQAVAGDRRKVELRCTDRARPVIERGRALQSDFFDGLMAGIDEPTRAAFFAAMARMEQNLDKILEETK